jgi:circadian clock protein KaiC
MERIPTFVPNLDQIIGGGLPAHSTVLISGVPGSGKTVLANQIIYGNATPDKKGLIVSTVSEPLARILRYAQEFTFFDLEKVTSAVLYEDLGPQLLQGNGEKALAHIEELVLKVQPTFLVVDSIRAIHELSSSPAATRRSLFRLAATLSTLPCTALLVGEYHPGDVPHTVEASIADVIIYLDNHNAGPYDRRVLRVRKMRGSAYISGEHTFRITPEGLTVFPRLVTPAKPLQYTPSAERVPVDIPGFDDALFPGGLLRGTTTLLAGDPGVGKTVTALHFLLGGARRGEAGIYITFQEDPSQLARIARNFGFDLERLVASKKLALLYTAPVELNIDEHALKITALAEKVGARRAVIDSISALELGAGGDRRRFFNFMYALVQRFKDRGITAFLTAEMGQLFASELAITGHGVSHIADNIILLRYTELSGEIRRAVTALAARGSDHSKRVYEYLISEAEGPRLHRPLSSAFNLFRPTAEKE